MHYYIIIAAHNEEKYIRATLQSVVNQTFLPKKMVLVNDNSTDGTLAIISEYVALYKWISVITLTSEAIHLPGSKVITAFNKGIETLDDNYDFIVKADADLIFPASYFETISSHFQKDNSVGMAGGFAYIEKKGEWVLENLTNKDHIRGAFKAYRKACFLEIGGLKPAMGWDTVDELLCKFYNWKVKTDVSLHVKHLKPTGAKYNKKSKYQQGEAFYRLGYGFWITCIAAFKLAVLKRKPIFFIDYMFGFCKAKMQNKSLLVTKEQAKFIRKYRWQQLKRFF